MSKLEDPAAKLLKEFIDAQVEKRLKEHDAQLLTKVISLLEKTTKVMKEVATKNNELFDKAITIVEKNTEKLHSMHEQIEHLHNYVFRKSPQKRDVYTA